MKLLNYQDTATFVVVQSAGYAGSKALVEQEDVPVIFLQGTALVHSGFQDNVDADAICYVDPGDEFVRDHNYRLEGMYVLAPLFEVDDDDGWYKVETVTVNRDHLLGNVIDNVELQLKKTRPVPNVS